MKLIGRDSELGVVRDHLRTRKNLAVVGVEGVGKTVLMHEAIANQANVVYCADSSTLKRACESVLTQLGITVSVADNIQRKRAVRNAVRNRKMCFIFDHVNWVTPKLFSFFDNLHESHQIILVARSVASADIGHLKLLLWDFDTLEMQNLDHAAALRLLHAQIEELKLNVPDLKQFEQDVWRLSCGNPRLIVDLCTQASKGHYVFGRHLDTRLLDLDRRINRLHL